MNMVSQAIDSAFVESMAHVQREIYDNSVEHGFWTGEGNQNIPTKLCLIHSEVSEALECYRKNNPPSEKCPGHSHLGEELADTVIRIMDLCEHLGVNLGQAILDKHKYNKMRSYQHGGKKC